MSAYENRTTEPKSIIRGERLEWTKTLSDHPATLWTLQYRIRGNGPGLDVTATASGTDHAAVITAANSSELSVGTYRWQAWVTEIADTTNTFIIGEGTVNVRQGFVAGEAVSVDLRSTARQALDAIRAMLINQASNDQLEYEIETPAGRRRVKRMSRTELLSFEKHYAAIVSREQAAERVRNGGRFGTIIKWRVRDN